LNIPLFQLQIHCENAVKHGLLNNEVVGGTIWIDFKETMDYLWIDVVDNGVGRRVATEIAQASETRSTGQGIKMLTNLHTILNQKNQPFTPFQISQFYTDAIFKHGPEGDFGTKVTIQLPKNFIYDL
jgi:sensor histidine kinase YesM